MDVQEAVIGAIAGIIGAVLGAWCAVVFPRKVQKRQTVLNLMEQYTSSDFSLVRAATWKVRQAWSNGDKSATSFFVVPANHSNQEQEEIAPNGLTLHQNLSRLLHFFGNLTQYCEANLVNVNVLRVLFKPHYDWYREFFNEFIAEYLAQFNEQKALQSWVINIPKLEAILDEPPSWWQRTVARIRRIPRSLTRAAQQRHAPDRE